MKKKLSFFFYRNLFSFYCLILQEHKLGMSAAITAALIAFTAFVVFATAVVQEYTVLLPLLLFLVLLSLLLQAFASDNMQLINKLKAKNKELASDKNAQEDELSAIIIPLKREIDNLKKYNMELHKKLKASNIRLAEKKNYLDDNSKNLKCEIDELKTKNIKLEKENNDLDDYIEALCQKINDFNREKIDLETKNMEQDFALDCLYLKIVKQDFVLAHLAHLNPGNQVAQTIEIAQWWAQLILSVHFKFVLVFVC